MPCLFNLSFLFPRTPSRTCLVLFSLLAIDQCFLDGLGWIGLVGSGAICSCTLRLVPLAIHTPSPSRSSFYFGAQARVNRPRLSAFVTAIHPTHIPTPSMPHSTSFLSKLRSIITMMPTDFFLCKCFRCLVVFVHFFKVSNVQHSPPPLSGHEEGKKVACPPSCLLVFFLWGMSPLCNNNYSQPRKKTLTFSTTCQQGVQAGCQWRT